MKMWTTLIILFLIPIAAAAQGTIRQVKEPGEFNKFLTPGLLDHWILQGAEGETLIVHVTSNEFDPVLELAIAGEPEDKLLFSLDDEGSESRFSIRLPETGEFKIRVHAFEYKGGGNYTLRIQRFLAQPLSIGEPLVGTFDRKGKSYLYFEAKEGQIFITDLKVASSRSWEMLDVKGRRSSGWQAARLIEESGEHSLVISGNPGNRFELLVREARQRNLVGDLELADSLERGEMDVWSLEGTPGEFRLLEIESTGQLTARLVYMPREKKKEDQPLVAAETWPEIQLMPVASKGGYLRFAAMLGRHGRYQLQLLAETSVTYNLKMEDPTKPIVPAQRPRGRLAVGGSAFYSFQAMPGQLLVAGLASKEFDPLLRLYDSSGDLVEQNDDGDGGVDSRIAHMVVKEGLYRLQVSSVGDGGGGAFTLALREEKLNELKVGERGKGLLHPGSTNFWTIEGEAGRTLLLSVRSSVCDPRVSVYSPDGVQLASDDNGGVGTDSLLAIRLPKTGRYTVWISSGHGAGEYSLRLIDGD